ncbi:hypothetical protein B0H11DRAFT_1335887 [Mycena galericulata]|nr:hypothetical protein B0H11DRAFT_1335887 [Mycena galericulata]
MMSAMAALPVMAPRKYRASDYGFWANDVQYPFQKTAIDPGALYDMASREYLCQGDESSTSSTSSSLTLGYATSNPARPNCSFKQSPYKINPIDNWNEPTIGSSIKRRCSDGSVAKRQRKLDVAQTRESDAMPPPADFPSPEFGLERLPRSLETWAQSERSSRPYARRPTNRRRRAVRKAFSPEEQIIDNNDSDTFSVGATVSKFTRRNSFPFVEQRCRGHCRSSC